MLISPEEFELLVRFCDWLRENEYEEQMLKTSDLLVAEFTDED